MSMTECCAVTSVQFIGNLILGIIWIAAFTTSHGLYIVSIVFIVIGGISCCVCIPVWLLYAIIITWDDD